MFYIYILHICICILHTLYITITITIAIPFTYMTLHSHSHSHLHVYVHVHLHYITLRYIALRFITLQKSHHITSHYITLHTHTGCTLHPGLHLKPERWNMTVLNPQSLEKKENGIHRPEPIFQLFGVYCNITYTIQESLNGCFCKLGVHFMGVFSTYGSIYKKGPKKP